MTRSLTARRPERAGDPGGTEQVPRTLDDVRGWLRPADAFLIDWLLDRQTRLGQRGDLVELGVFHGKSAIHIGYHIADGERMVVCDLFDQAGTSTALRPGARGFYKDLSQRLFERNYLVFHKSLPVVVQGPSGGILAHVEPGTCRLVHIDASHLYEHVRVDARSARTMLGEDGIVVFDDYRTAHAPGTAAAVWEAMANDGLRVICLTDNKFYGTWGDADTVRKDLVAALVGSSAYRVDVEPVMGQQLARLVPKPDPDAPGGQPRRRPRWWRRAAVAVLPPLVTNSLRRIVR
jgi:hypothetical protein